MTANGTAHHSPPPPGSYVPCVTFFKEDESLDMDAIKAHALRMAQGGLSGLVIHGSNGEAVHISAEGESISIRLYVSAILSFTSCHPLEATIAAMHSARALDRSTRNYTAISSFRSVLR